MVHGEGSSGSAAVAASFVPAAFTAVCTEMQNGVPLVPYQKVCRFLEEKDKAKLQQDFRKTAK